MAMAASTSPTLRTTGSRSSRSREETGFCFARKAEVERYAELVKGARVIAAGFAFFGCFLILVSVGPQSWPLVLGWLGAALVVGLVWLRMPSALKLGFAVFLLALCVLL